MSHWRTSRGNVGGNHFPGSPNDSKYALPQHSILSSGSALELREIGQPSFDERELGAHCLFFALLVSPFLIVGGLVIGYLAFVS